MPPTQIGPYRIMRPLGQGGMGVVYEAIQDPIGRRVAVKVLLPQYATSQEVLQRFFNEARAVNLIEHPSIVQVSDYGQEPDGAAYLVMEYLRGEVLAERMDRTHSGGKRLPLADVLQIAVQIAGGLAAAHLKSVIHRDLKPSNVMLVIDSAFPGGERVKILDFGLAKLLHGKAQGTAPHVVLGTPQYMSPEQCRGVGGVDEKTDVYALGLMLFELLAGRPPFIAEGPVEYIGQHVFREPPSLRSFAPTISDSIETLVHSLLIKDKALRPIMREVETKLARELSQLSNSALPASSPAIENADETRPSLPRQSSPSTLGGSLGQPLQPARKLRIRLAIGIAIPGALALLVAVWGIHRHWTHRPPSPVVVAVPAASSNTARDEGAKGAPEPPRAAPVPILQATAAPAPQPAPQPSLQPSPQPSPQPSLQPSLQPSPGSGETVHSASPIDVSATIEKAQNAAAKGQYRKVISLALPLTLSSPVRAWRLIGSAACGLKDLKLADNAYRHLDTNGKLYLIIMCNRQSIQVIDGRFKYHPVAK